MSDARAVFSLTLRDEASKQLQQFEGNYQRTVRNTESAGGGFGDAVGLVANVGSMEGALTSLGATVPQVQAAMAAFGVVTTAVDWARQAAEVQAVENAFDRMAGSVGVSGASILSALQDVSSGMITNKDLMLAANSAMALGVADTAEEVSRFQPLIV